MKINKKGFTLIELLVVISIIGILAGILVLVINPTQQQNKARNATIRSTILKIAYGVNAAKAASGSYPSSAQIPSELSSTSSGVASTGYLSYHFLVDGVSIPGNICGTNGVPTAGTTPCRFTAYSSAANATSFRIYAKGFSVSAATPFVAIVYDSAQGLFECVNAAEMTLNFNTADLIATTYCNRVD